MPQVADFTNPVEVVGIKGETYEVVGTDELDGLVHMKRTMVENGYAPRHYILRRIITGRKKPSQIRCLYGIKSKTFKNAY